VNTSFATSPDGVRVAYDVSGMGPAIMLLHGGGRTRRNWHEVGYVERLRGDFKVIAVDIRGNGESDKPTDPAYYTTDKMGQDLLAVADACGVERFTIWGFSYGGNIGRYLAAQSERVAKIIIMGIPFGLGASGDFRRSIEDSRAHWAPSCKPNWMARLISNHSPRMTRTICKRTNVPVTLAWLSAMLDWAAIEPADLRCPTLWLLGSENKNAMASLQECEEALKESKVQVHVVEGLNHLQEFTEIDKVLPAMLAFTRSDVSVR